MSYKNLEEINKDKESLLSSAYSVLQKALDRGYFEDNDQDSGEEADEKVTARFIIDDIEQHFSKVNEFQNTKVAESKVNLETAYRYDICDDNNGQRAYLFCHIDNDEMFDLEQEYKASFDYRESMFKEDDVNELFIEWLKNKGYSVVIINRPSYWLNLFDR